MKKLYFESPVSFSNGGNIKASSWDNLSLREKSEMIGVAVRNGITNLKDIRQKYNEFAEGGNLFVSGGEIDEPEEKEPINNTTPDMRWHQWWLNNRTEQLGRNVMETEIHPIWEIQRLTGLGFPGYSAVGKEQIPKQLNNANKYTEYVGGNNVPENKYRVMSRGYRGIEEMSQDEFFKRKGALGSTYPFLKSIVYPSDWSASKAKTHERTHALGATPQRIKIGRILKYNYELKNLDRYLDDPDEIYSRLMDFRQAYDLDPKKKVTKKDLEEWRKKKYGSNTITAPGSDLIDRYDDDVLLQFFNDVAYYPIEDRGIFGQFLANGGRLCVYQPHVGGRRHFKESGVNLFEDGGDINTWLKAGLSVAKALGIDKKYKGNPEDFRYKQNLYSIIDPTTGFPRNVEEAVSFKSQVDAARNPKNSFKYARKYRDDTADAGWAKRLGLPYDQNLLIDNPDGSVRLSEAVEAEIPTDTLFLENRIKTNEELLAKYRRNGAAFPERVKLINDGIKADRQALDALRLTYRTGKPVVINEDANNSRRWIIDSVPSWKPSPLNILHNYTIQYDKDNNVMNYWDLYDFNQFEDFVPGDPYTIKGSIKLNK